MFLYKTIKNDRTAYGGFVYPKVGNFVEAKDWNPDPEIECGFGLHGNSLEPHQGGYMDLFDGNILLEIDVNKKDVVRGKGKYRFKKGKIVREWVIGKDTYNKIISYLSGGNLAAVGNWRKGLSKKLRVTAWERLEGEHLYLAGATWEGVTKEMIKEGWKRVQGKALVLAGMYWPSVTKEMVEEGYTRLRGSWLNKAKNMW